MGTRRDLTRKDQLSGESHAEIKGAWNAALADIAEEVKLPGHRRLKGYQLLSALVLWFVRLPAQQRAIFAEVIVDDLARFMMGADLGASCRPDRADPAAIGDVIDAPAPGGARRPKRTA